MTNAQVRRSFFVLMLVPSFALAGAESSIKAVSSAVQSGLTKLVQFPVNVVKIVTGAAVTGVTTVGNGVLAGVDGLGNVSERLVVKTTSPFVNFYKNHATGTKRFTVVAALAGATYALYQAYYPVAQQKCTAKYNK